MTAVSVPIAPAKDAGLRPLPWRRMVWVTWRHHRVALGGVAVFLGVLGGVALDRRASGAPRVCRRGGLSALELGCLPEPGHRLREHERHSKRWLRPPAIARADRGIHRAAHAGP